MSDKDEVAKLMAGAIEAAKDYSIDQTSKDYIAGYDAGIKAMLGIVRVAYIATLKMAEENKHDLLINKMMQGYAEGLSILLDAGGNLAPPDYEAKV